MVPEGCRSFSEGRMWRGVSAFTWGTTRDWDLIRRTLSSLCPGVCLVAAPGDIGKRVLVQALAEEVKLAACYLGRVRHRKIRHSEVGTSQRDHI
eukprot:scaffold334120_cov39-Attheya_sp.AAC.1